MAKELTGETRDILKMLPSEILVAFNKIKNNGVIYKAFQNFVQSQKQIKLDQIYRLRRAKGVDGAVANQLEHEYYCGRISSYVILLQVMENASKELERRERKK